MKLILITFMPLVIFGCACQNNQEKSFDEAKSSEIINNLVFTDPASPNQPSHPLICVEGGDYPNGVELVFRETNDDSKWIHAVFPEGVKAPDKLKGEITLKGYFQEIQKKDRFVYKKPGEDYQYFVVISWTEQK